MKPEEPSPKTVTDNSAPVKRNAEPAGSSNSAESAASQTDTPKNRSVETTEKTVSSAQSSQNASQTATPAKATSIGRANTGFKPTPVSYTNGNEPARNDNTNAMAPAPQPGSPEYVTAGQPESTRSTDYLHDGGSHQPTPGNPHPGGNYPPQGPGNMYPGQPHPGHAGVNPPHGAYDMHFGPQPGYHIPWRYGDPTPSYYYRNPDPIQHVAVAATYDVLRRQAAALLGTRIYTYYNMNSGVGGFRFLDESWQRPPIETILDTYYRPSISRLTDVHYPPAPARGKPDPFLDDAHAIFSDHTTTYGSEADFINAAVDNEAIAIELFGYSSMVPNDLVEPVRAAVEEGLLRRGRHYILDAQTVLGTVYNGEPVYYDGNRGYFHFTDRMQRLYCKGVRYVISGYISQYYTRTFKRSPSSRYLTFETSLTVHLTAYDLDNRTVLQTKVITVHDTGNNQLEADLNAIDELPYYVKNFASLNFRISTTISNLSDFRRSGKAKGCRIGAGTTLGMQRYDHLDVYTPAGGNTVSYLGSVRVDQLGPDFSECTITSGAKKITKAAQAGCELLLLSR